MAAFCCICGVPVDLGRLFDDGDPGYRMFVEAVTRRVKEAREQAHGVND